MVKITYNESADMMRIEYRDKCIFHGNYWDFDDSPHGLKKLFEQLGLDVELTESVNDELEDDEEIDSEFDDFDEEYDEDY